MSAEYPMDRPVIYRVDARVWLEEESRRRRRPVRLDSIPAEILDRLAGLGFRWLWLEGVWEGGERSREIQRRRASLLDEARELLPDLRLEDIGGSPLAVAAYRIRPDLGGDDSLEGLRGELARRDLGLILDFIPGRAALDHPWVLEHPEYFIHAGGEAAAGHARLTQRAPSSSLLALAPASLGPEGGPLVPDALALNARHAGLRSAVIAELERVAALADGLRIVGAGELSAAAVAEAWGDRSLPADGSAPADGPFWPEALARLRARTPRLFLLWDDGLPDGGALEGPPSDAPDGRDGGLRGPAGGLPAARLDASMREALLGLDGTLVRDRLHAFVAAPTPCVNALEAPASPGVAAMLPPARLLAATIVSCLAPGGVVIGDGQMEGRRGRRIPELLRRPEEPPDREVKGFHEALLDILGRPEVARGACTVLPVSEAWEGNDSWRQFVALLWRLESGETLLAAVNLGSMQAQCYVDLSALDTEGDEWVFQDLLSFAVYPRDGNDLALRGLYLDLTEWDYNVFEVVRGRALG